MIWTSPIKQTMISYILAFDSRMGAMVLKIGISSISMQVHPKVFFSIIAYTWIILIMQAVQPMVTVLRIQLDRRMIASLLNQLQAPEAYNQRFHFFENLFCNLLLLNHISFSHSQVYESRFEILKLRTVLVQVIVSHRIPKRDHKPNCAKRKYDSIKVDGKISF